MESETGSLRGQLQEMQSALDGVPSQYRCREEKCEELEKDASKLQELLCGAEERMKQLEASVEHKSKEL